MGDAVCVAQNTQYKFHHETEPETRHSGTHTWARDIWAQTSGCRHLGARIFGRKDIWVQDIWARNVLLRTFYNYLSTFLNNLMNIFTKILYLQSSG